MSRSTAGIPQHCPPSKEGTNISGSFTPSPEELASLASMTMARVSPGLVMPTLSGIPTSYTHTQGDDAALRFARTLVELGLGSIKLWEHHSGNPSVFSRDAINEWLRDLGVSSMEGHVDLDLAIVDNLDVNGYMDQEGKPKKAGNFYALLETSDRCGFIKIGEQLDQLEKEQVGLGSAFYLALSFTLNQWMEVYDVANATQYVERWKESIEQDMDTDTNQTFDEYCLANEITFPDITTASPACTQNIHYGKSWKANLARAVALLKKHRNGVYSAWIEPVIAMASIRQPASGVNYQDIDGVWDDGPLPNWLVAFYEHDPITQAFDEEGQNMYETSHSPVWLESFDPSSVSEVRRVLIYVQRFVEINRNMVTLLKAIERGSTNGSTNRPEYVDELRAA